MMACWKDESLNYNAKIVSDLFWTPTRRYAHQNQEIVLLQFEHIIPFSRLWVGVATRGCSEQIWNYFRVVVQWFTFPTSHHVTRLNIAGRFHSGPTEIVRFWGVFHFCNNVQPQGYKSIRFSILILILILLLYENPYWYWYWYCSSNILQNQYIAQQYIAKSIYCSSKSIYC